VLGLLSEESLILHLVGLTSIGKSTDLLAAGSTYGGGGRDGFVESWRSTANALEATASVHNDGFLPLDELSQANPREIDQVVYNHLSSRNLGNNRTLLALADLRYWTR
jgi:uncharacterized protein (DUF927 family)